MPNINVKVDEEVLRAVRLKCAAEDISQQEFVIRALVNEASGIKPESRVKGESDGDDERGAEGGGGQDHGKAGATDGGGERNLRSAGDEGRRVPKARGAKKGATESEPGAVDGGVRKDTSGEGKGQGEGGEEHGVNCRCFICKPPK